MRRSVNRGAESPARQNGRAERGEAGGGEDDEARPADLNEEEQDPAERRELRAKYRNLISTIQQNREDMLKPDNDKLFEVLEEANTLFKDVRQPREVALDAQLLVLASDLGKDKASQMYTESAFDPSACIENLLNFMGLNRLEDEEEGEEENVSAGGYLPPDAWQKVAQRAEVCFRTAPTFHYMLGSFLAEPPPPRQRAERERKALNKEVARTMPTQLKKMEESHQEATEKEVERILGYLRNYFADDPTSPISYYEFVIDPKSFARTVENIFHTSFLIRDGLARMYEDNNKLPCIAPVEEGEVESGGSSRRQQCVISISPRSWRELVEAFDIKDPLIPGPSTQAQAQ